MNCESANGDGTNRSGDDRLQNDDAIARSLLHILSSPFRHLALDIYRAVQLLTLSLPMFALSTCCRFGCRGSYRDYFRLWQQRTEFEIKGPDLLERHKSNFYCHKYHQTTRRVHTPYPITTVQK